MLYVSFVEILPKALADLSHHFSAAAAGWLTNAGFFGGMLGMALIDYLVPSAENPHELRADADLDALKGDALASGPGAAGRRDLWRIGFLTATAIAIHNFRRHGHVPRGAGRSADGDRHRHCGRAPQHPGRHQRGRADLLRHGTPAPRFVLSFFRGSPTAGGVVAAVAL